ncbi:cellulose binding domain-containing protein [Phytohabitans kaempferiae]|uniref:Cellulose binding domain-containing protein n=1 Tax=Phytohabitans kaempferiae TaxID=1620943 RepID=A0ABV6M2G3_9ACTN
MRIGSGTPRVLRPGTVEMLPWVPTAVGVTILVGLLGFAIVSLRPADPVTRGAPPPPVSPPFLAGPAAPATTEAEVVTPEASVDPAPAPISLPPATSPPAPPRRTTAAPPPAPPREIAGRYRVVESFKDSFIGEVRVTNAAGSPRNWSVELRFPSGVGGLRTFWVDGAQQPALRRDGSRFTFTGAAPLGPGKAAPLRFHFDRTGPVPTPTVCTANGATCAGV